MSPGSNAESYPAFAHIGLRENPGKTLNQTPVDTAMSTCDSTVPRIFLFGDFLLPHSFQKTKLLLWLTAPAACYWPSSKLVGSEDGQPVLKMANNRLKHVNQLNDICGQYGMEKNANKTKTMVVARKIKKVNLRILNEAVEQVDSFKYLGYTINSNMSCNQEVIKRIVVVNKSADMSLSHKCHRPGLGSNPQPRAQNSSAIPTALPRPKAVAVKEKV
ncbi:hypothetical protein ANN_08535 [Periplaneta americana]|uniref:Uncharacterized protein n=1 Tax=Periplaneta americana TaxID=6978 RepID=A0ABQ8T1N7_PERAM|nr:hypothetical protein ANN_08535 [Periplaneta americana]